jgi:DNA primase
VRVAALPEADDPDTFVHARGGDAMRALLDQAPSAIDHAVTGAMKRHAGAGVAGTVKIVEEIKPLLRAIKDPLQRDLYIEGAAKRIGIDGRMLRGHLSRSASPGGSHAEPPRAPASSPPRPPPAHVEPPSKVELALLRLLVESPEVTLRALESKRALGAFHHPSLRAAVSAGWASWRAGTPFDAHRAIEAAREEGGADDETVRVIRETLMDQLPNANRLEDCLENLLRSDKQRTLLDLKARIKRETDPEALERLNTELAAVLRS